MKQLIANVQYCDPHSILVINTKGRLRRVFCPFRVLCIQAVEAIPAGSWVMVEEVQKVIHDELIFIVCGEPYSYKHFHIIIHF